MMKCTLYQKKEELVISNGSPCACIRSILYVFLLHFIKKYMILFVHEEMYESSHLDVK